MKSLKLLVAAGAFAAMLGHSALAVTPTHIYITGSSAFRTAALAAVAANLTGLPTQQSGGGTGNDTSVANTGKTSFIFEGGTFGGAAVTVCCTFTGSLTGTATTVGSVAIPFLPDGSTGTSNPSCYDDVTGATPHAGYPTAVPDFCFSDVDQGTTGFNSSNNSTSPAYQDANSAVVGIVTFKWMASVGFPVGSGSTGTQNIISSYSLDPTSISYLFKNGKLPLSFLSGNTGTDEFTELFAAGRNPDSGTRATALADGLYGVNTHVKQYEAFAPAIGGTVTSHQLFPIQNIGGFISTVALGNSGEATGGNLRNYMTYILPKSGLTGEGFAGHTTVTAAYYITYLGTSDAATVEGTSANSAVELAYKGVNFSIPNIYAGKYTFWSYEHVFDIGGGNNSNGNNTTSQAFETAVIGSVQGFTTTSTQLSGTGIGIGDTSMTATRVGQVTTAPASPNFNF